MNDTLSQPSTEQVFRRLDEPLRLFGNALPPWTWIAILGFVLVIGFFYIGWMYLRDSRTIGPWWSSFLGLLRASVYVLLAFVFLLPAQQTWYENKQRSKVVLLFDSSLSMINTRDDLPPEGTKYLDMPTRQDKVVNFLSDAESKFIERLEERNPITTYRFARGLDPDSRYHAEGRFWGKADREKVLNALEGEEVPPGNTLARPHWESLLQPLVKDPKLPGFKVRDQIPESWKPEEIRTKELLRQVTSNQVQVEKRFFDGTAVGESLLEVIKQERSNMVQGIVVFTDGRSTDGSLQSIRDAAVSANSAGIPIFVVVVGEDRPKVSIDLVDIRVPPLIRPEDRFRVAVSVNGYDMPNEPFEIDLDVTRVQPNKNNPREMIEKPIELVRIDEKGQILENSEFALGKKVTLKGAQFAKEKPVFKPGNPPNAQVEFEIDASVLAKAAGKEAEGSGKLGIAPDDDSELRFRARVPKDKREITDLTEHVSEAADMRVQKKPLRVLLFTSAGGVREYQFLRTVLVREMDNARAEICIHIQKLPGGETRSGVVQDVDPNRILTEFPTKRTLVAGDKDPFYSLASYDVIVAFDVDWFQLSKEQMQMVSDWVFKDGGGLINVAGPLNTQEMARPNLREQIKPVLDMLPVELEDARKEDQETDTPRRLLFPQANPEMEYIRLDDTDAKAAWKKGWDRYFNEVQDEDGKVASSADPTGPPERGFFTYFPSRSVKQSAMVIASFDSPTALLPGKADNQPFFVTGPWGAGKVVWLASGELWRLRSFRDGYYTRFWTKLLRDIGSNSINTLNKRINPIMSRFGTLNKFQTFEARFVDINGDPIRRSVKTPPRLQVVLPEGARAQKNDTVQIKAGEHVNKEGKVVEVVSERDPTGAEIRKLKLAGVPGVARDTLLEIDEKQVEVMSPPLDFKPRLGTQPSEDLDRKNDGWFKVDFQPRTVGEYKLKVRYEDAADNVYNHKFIVRDYNPEIDNVRPDMEALAEMASSAKSVLDRLGDEEQKQRLRDQLKRPAPKEGEKKEGESDESLRLLFDLQTARLIPDCMRTQRNDVKTRGKVQDLWDRGFIIDEAPPSSEEAAGLRLPGGYQLRWGNPGEASVSIFLIVIVGLLSIEWLTRKLLRLA